MNTRPYVLHRCLAIVAATFGLSVVAHAQFQIRPIVGLQTIIFNGDNQARRPISQGDDPALGFGGGLSTSNNGARIGIELVPDPEGIIRIPISAEYYWFEGKTTFAIAGRSRRIEQFRLQFGANMLSIGTGIKASFFNASKLSVYLSGEGRFNYIPPTRLNRRHYFFDTGEHVSKEVTVAPDSVSRTRYGAVLKIGTQAAFFDPLLLDFSIGYGAVNLGGKNVDPVTRRDILTAEPTLQTAEHTLGFITFGLSIHWIL